MMARRRKNQAPQSGDNTNGKSLDEKRALLFYHVAQYMEAKKAKEKAFSDFKTVIGVAEMDGISLRDIKDAIDMESPDGEKKLKGRVANTLRVAHMVGAPFVQGDLFPELMPTDPAFEDGKLKGLQGHPRKCSPQWVNAEATWIDGWNDGNSARNTALAERLKMTLLPTDDGEGEADTFGAVAIQKTAEDDAADAAAQPNADRKSVV